MPVSAAVTAAVPALPCRGALFNQAGLLWASSKVKTQSLIHTGVEPAPPRSETECSPTGLMQIEENAVCVFMYSFVQDAICGSELT